MLNVPDSSQVELPLLGTAADLSIAEIELSRKFDELHNLIYSTGGIRPTNAAIEEVAKLLAVRLWDNAVEARSGRSHLGKLSDYSSGESKIAAVKDAFQAMLRDPKMGTRDTLGVLHPLWPIDEPFRVTNAEVVEQAYVVISNLVESDVKISDPLGAAFDAFLSGKYDHAGGLGTYLTPSSIARMMTDIAFEMLDMSSISDPRIIDPFCGTGRFLVSAYEALARKGTSDERLERIVNSGLVGADQSPQSIAKSGLNLMLLGAEHPRVFHVEDSITSPVLNQANGLYDLVLTNPPFGGAKYKDNIGIQRTREVFESLRGRVIDPALAGTALSINLVRPGGVVGIVLPDGIINSQPFVELTKSSEIQACVVVSLPTATFSLSGTMAKTSAVFLRKKGKWSSRTAIARIDHVGFKKQAGKPVPDPEGNDANAIPELIKESLNLEDSSGELTVLSERPLVCSVRSDAIESLDPARLDPDGTRDRAALLDAGGTRASSVISHSRTRRARREPVEPFISVLHVDELGNVDWAAADSYEPATNGQIATGGQLLVSLLNPSKFRASVVPWNVERTQCSLEFGVFDCAIDPYAVLGLLYRQDVRSQLRPLGSGTSSSRRRIRESDVEDLVLPRITRSKTETLAKTVLEAMDAIHHGRKMLESVYNASVADS